ncbi:MAG TPA: S-layer homology domain-containing protein [Fimbriimonadaceae bacterium]|nr:S-layer homology domain-containing protein [Fimbriimonadaceae bacterium]
MPRFLTLLVVMVILTGVATAQNSFPSPARGHEGYKAFARLRARGFVPGRHVIGVLGSDQIVADLVKGVDGLPQFLGGLRRRGIEDELLLGSAWRQKFELAIQAYAADIRKAGRDPQKLIKQVVACQPLADKLAAALGYQAPFRDVPPSHWAYKAVQELKEAGILVGYPDSPDLAHK